MRSVVLTVPVGVDGLTTGRSIATWATTKLATDAGGWRQVGRTGLPMIWPIFRDADSDVASHANETHPSDDLESYGPAMTSWSLPSCTAEAPLTGRRAMPPPWWGRIVPDLLGYVVGSPAVFGFAGFNGRRLVDNAAEVMFSLATNSAVPSGLTPPTASAARRFPVRHPIRGLAAASTESGR